MIEFAAAVMFGVLGAALVIHHRAFVWAMIWFTTRFAFGVAFFTALTWVATKGRLH